MMWGNDPTTVMGDIFCALIGDGTPLVEEDECRSVPDTNTCDVLLRGQWYRLTIESIDEPISVEEHRGE